MTILKPDSRVTIDVLSGVWTGTVLNISIEAVDVWLATLTPTCAGVKIDTSSDVGVGILVDVDVNCTMNVLTAVVTAA